VQRAVKRTRTHCHQQDCWRERAAPEVSTALQGCLELLPSSELPNTLLLVSVLLPLLPPQNVRLLLW